MAASVHPGAAAFEPNGRPRPEASAARGPSNREDGQDHDKGGEASAGEEEEVGRRGGAIGVGGSRGE